MFKQVLLVASLLALLLAPIAHADDDKPTLAFLRFGASTLISIAESGILDTLELYGFISADERAGLNESVDLEGEHLNVIYSDAGWDIATANLIIEDALDRGADVLMTWSAPVTQIAANMLSEMEDPPHHHLHHRHDALHQGRRGNALRQAGFRRRHADHDPVRGIC